MAQHPIILSAEKVIRRAADLLEGEGFSRKDGARFGVPEAIAEAAGDDVLARVVAERQLVTHGIDVWWSDLLCVDGDDAAANLRARAVIDPAELYGPNHEAILGLLRACSIVTAAQLNGIGNLVHGTEWQEYARCVELAAAYDRQKLLIQVTEDVHFATSHYATTPAGVTHRLKGIRGFECVAAYYVLNDVLSVEDGRLLCGPVSKILFASQAFMR